MGSLAELFKKSSLKIKELETKKHSHCYYSSEDDDISFTLRILGKSRKSLGGILLDKYATSTTMATMVPTQANIGEGGKEQSKGFVIGCNCMLHSTEHL